MQRFILFPKEIFFDRYIIHGVSASCSRESCVHIFKKKGGGKQKGLRGSWIIILVKKIKWDTRLGGGFFFEGN